MVRAPAAQCHTREKDPLTLSTEHHGHDHSHGHGHEHGEAHSHDHEHAHDHGEAAVVNLEPVRNSSSSRANVSVAGVVRYNMEQFIELINIAARSNPRRAPSQRGPDEEARPRPRHARRPCPCHR